MTDANDLLPCPFCGGEAEIVHIEYGVNAGGSCVCCTKCMASGNVEFGRKENFVPNWNRRALPAAPRPEATKWLGELLAIIHGDGGHYQAQHGDEKAVNDAHAILAEMFSSPEAEPVAWDVQQVALSVAAMAEEWYEGNWQDHLPFHLIEKRLSRYTTPAPVVPAEGLDALIGEIVFEAVNSEIDRGLAGRIIAALRAQQPATPVSGVTVQEDTHNDR